MSWRGGGGGGVGVTLHTHRWRQGRTVVSRGEDMQITHLRATRVSEMQRAVRGMRLQDDALGGLEHVAAVYFFELKRLAARHRAVSG
jgi:hypothetical protein